MGQINHASLWLCFLAKPLSFKQKLLSVISPALTKTYMIFEQVGALTNNKLHLIMRYTLVLHVLHSFSSLPIALLLYFTFCKGFHFKRLHLKVREKFVCVCV